MIQQTFKDFEISEFAIRNREFPGFEQDYLVLDSLLRKYNPKSVFEIGTNFGTGTNIICNAVPNAEVYSLDLPFGEGDAPLYSGGKDHTGQNCKRPFKQFRASSLDFDFMKYPCEAYYVDGCHDYKHVQWESRSICFCDPIIIIYHDADIPEVMEGIKYGENIFEFRYQLYRVTDTRIAYLLRK